MSKEFNHVIDAFVDGDEDKMLSYLRAVPNEKLVDMIKRVSRELLTMGHNEKAQHFAEWLYDHDMGGHV